MTPKGERECRSREVGKGKRTKEGLYFRDLKVAVCSGEGRLSDLLKKADTFEEKRKQPSKKGQRGEELL